MTPTLPSPKKTPVPPPSTGREPAKRNDVIAIYLFVALILLGMIAAGVSFMRM